MKKLIGIILAIVLFVGGGVGGYFIHARFSKTNTYKIANAKTVINKVCKAAGWLQNSETTSSESEIVSVEYEEYSGESVDYNSKEDFVKTFILALNYACENDINANVFYTSTAKYKAGLTTYTGEMNIYVKLTENAAYFYIKDVYNDISAVMEVTSKDNTKDNCQINAYLQGTFGAAYGLTYIEIKCDSNKVVQFSYSEITTVSKVNDLNSVSDDFITDITVYDCNVIAHNCLNTTKSEMTDAEILDIVSATVEKFNTIQFIDVSFKKFEKIEFLKKVYQSLGYEVVD